MANAKFSTLGAQFVANAAAIATAAGGTIVTSDITALGNILNNLGAGRLDLMWQILKTADGPGGNSLAIQLTPG